MGSSSRRKDFTDGKHEEDRECDASSQSPEQIKARKATKVKDKKKNRFHDRIGSITYHQAGKLLGNDGAKLIQPGGRKFDILSGRDVYLGADLFRVRVDDAAMDSVAITTLALHPRRKKELEANCDQCELPCEHIGAALEYLLTTKSVLGLAMPPDESVPLENLTDEELFQRAMAEREHRAAKEAMAVRSLDKENPWVDYVVTSKQSGRSYRVALRGMQSGTSFCTCPDFRANRLGTCKAYFESLRGSRRSRTATTQNQLAQ